MGLTATELAAIAADMSPPGISLVPEPEPQVDSPVREARTGNSMGLDAVREDVAPSQHATNERLEVGPSSSETDDVPELPGRDTRQEQRSRHLQKQRQRSGSAAAHAADIERAMLKHSVEPAAATTTTTTPSSLEQRIESFLAGTLAACYSESYGPKAADLITLNWMMTGVPIGSPGAIGATSERGYDSSELIAFAIKVWLLLGGLS